MTDARLVRCEVCKHHDHESRLVNGTCQWCWIAEILASDGEVENLLENA